MVMLTLPTLLKKNCDTHITALQGKKEEVVEEEDLMDEDTIIFLTHL